MKKVKKPARRTADLVDSDEEDNGPKRSEESKSVEKGLDAKSKCLSKDSNNALHTDYVFEGRELSRIKLKEAHRCISKKEGYHLLSSFIKSKVMNHSVCESEFPSSHVMSVARRMGKELKNGKSQYSELVL